MSLFKAIIFDLDGTLLNTLEDLASSMNNVLQKHNYSPYPTDQYRFFVGEGMNNLVKKATNPFTDDKKKIQQMQSEMKLEYEKMWHKTTKPYDGINETLMNLDDAGFLLAVLSNKPDEMTKIIVSFFFPEIHFFQVCGASQDVPKKPDPAGVFSIMNQSFLSPEEFIMIGDSSIDIQTAINASIFPSGVLWGFRDKEELFKAGAKQFFKNPGEIYNFLTHSN